jgi:hypothetical protein
VSEVNMDIRVTACRQAQAIVRIVQREGHHLDSEGPEQFSNTSPISASIADPPPTAIHTIYSIAVCITKQK